MNRYKSDTYSDDQENGNALFSGIPVKLPPVFSVYLLLKLMDFTVLSFYSPSLHPASNLTTITKKSDKKKILILI
ncbi:hypothetical protein [Desulfonema magnum]|uniref:hypothetical protein n=1 Tax=Desulfonema magnum TaxID=45655 RepID=UPI001A9ADA8B|nr:hypothetical protein [Desulfonema magnum]